MVSFCARACILSSSRSLSSRICTRRSSPSKLAASSSLSRCSREILNLSSHDGSAEKEYHEHVYRGKGAKLGEFFPFPQICFASKNWFDCQAATKEGNLSRDFSFKPSRNEEEDIRFWSVAADPGTDPDPPVMAPEPSCVFHPFPSMSLRNRLLQGPRIVVTTLFSATVP